MYAVSDSSPREVASPGRVGVCPMCRKCVRPKCGQLVVWHWAHIASDDCDSWAEPETEWHRRWQMLVPRHQREIIIGAHRADIVTSSGTVVELQHSSISGPEIHARERHYGRMIWIFDVSAPYDADRLDVRDRGSYVTFRWKHPRKSISLCRKPVYLDLGDGWVLHLRRIYPTAPCGGSGRLGTTEDLVSWMTGDGAAP